MVNTNLLKGKIVAAGYSQGALAKELEMSENTLSARLNNKSSFNIGEVVAICEKLGIDDPNEIVSIFLHKTSH